MTHTWI